MFLVNPFTSEIDLPVHGKSSWRFGDFLRHLRQNLRLKGIRKYDISANQKQNLIIIKILKDKLSLWNIGLFYKLIQSIEESPRPLQQRHLLLRRRQGDRTDQPRFHDCF